MKWWQSRRCSLVGCCWKNQNRMSVLKFPMPDSRNICDFQVLIVFVGRMLCKYTILFPMIDVFWKSHLNIHHFPFSPITTESILQRFHPNCVCQSESTKFQSSLKSSSKSVESGFKIPNLPRICCTFFFQISAWLPTSGIFNFTNDILNFLYYRSKKLKCWQKWSLVFHQIIPIKQNLNFWDRMI